MVTLVHLGYKGNIWSSCFHTFVVRILCFLNNIMQDLRKLVVGSVALRPKSTAMVIAGRSVHLTTLFPGQA